MYERIHGAQPGREAAPARLPDAVRHWWVEDEQGRFPALLLEWRQVASGWQGRVVRPALEDGAWLVVEEWLPAAGLTPADG